jgi:hypothetical protein
MSSTRRAQAAASATCFTRRPFRTFRTAYPNSQFGTPSIGGGQQNLWIGLAANAANAGMLLSPNPNPTVGTSQDVFAWDRNGNGVIDTNEYFFFGGNPGSELRD